MDNDNHFSSKNDLPFYNPTRNVEIPLGCSKAKAIAKERHYLQEDRKIKNNFFISYEKNSARIAEAAEEKNAYLIAEGLSKSADLEHQAKGSKLLELLGDRYLNKFGNNSSEKKQNVIINDVKDDNKDSEVIAI